MSATPPPSWFALPDAPPTPSGAYLATEEEAVERLQRRLAGQLIVRLAVATLLLGGTLGLSLLAGRPLTAFTPRALTLLIVATYLLSACAAASLRSRRRDTRVRSARALLGWDLILVTALVYLSGGGSSGFPFLYGIAIVHAALSLGARTTVIAGALAFLFFVSLVAAPGPRRARPQRSRDGPRALPRHGSRRLPRAPAPPRRRPHPRGGA